ncbi:hypothetical protein [Kineosporia mesophila]|uniref:hypothetical protein n=1 Tax=Kineosporia mesophila TaxID=566012 RepID=UPI001E648BE6|nr:hypothetical protein [Kineosporia mesophila]MCD5352013.1 hypothetical protein [Kineosporia mesophila]
MASFAAVIALAGAGTAVAAGKGVFRDETGNVGIDASVLSPVYEGHRRTITDLEQLEIEGKAHYSVNNRELACQGISLYFDTEAERQAYLQEVEPRHQAAMQEESAHPDEDPCKPYTHSPRFAEQ